MAYVVAALWRAKKGQEETIASVIEKMTPLSRQEPGCSVLSGAAICDRSATVFAV